VPYAIKFMKLTEEIVQTPWDRSFETAKRHAQDHLQMHRSRSGATHVEIYDSGTGKLMFTHPRLLDARGAYDPWGR
jgi:hypothetical protein